MAYTLITDKRFGQLTGVRILEKRAADKHLLGLWRCDCGEEREIIISRVVNGYTKSCGCLISQNGTTHGMKKTSTYSSWSAAKTRCHNQNSKDFPRYGALGISMHERWRDSFEEFYKDMGDRPANTSLDRWPNRNGNYEPGNCRWATREEQGRNRDKSIWVTWKGRVVHLSETAADLGITYGAAFQRLKRGKLYGATIHNH